MTKAISDKSQELQPIIFVYYNVEEFKVNWIVDNW